MDREDGIDYALAIAIGLAAGIGATLLLRAGRHRPRRLLDDFEPVREQVQRGLGAARDHARDGWQRVRGSRRG